MAQSVYSGVKPTLPRRQVNGLTRLLLNSSSRPRVQSRIITLCSGRANPIQVGETSHQTRNKGALRTFPEEIPNVAYLQVNLTRRQERMTSSTGRDLSRSNGGFCRESWANEPRRAEGKACVGGKGSLARGKAFSRPAPHSRAGRRP